MHSSNSTFEDNYYEGGKLWVYKITSSITQNLLCSSKKWRKSSWTRLKRYCERITVAHEVYSGERVGDYECRIRVQGVPLYARAVIIGYDGYLEFGYLSRAQGEWVYNCASQEKLSFSDTGIFLDGKELRLGRHSLIPYINKVIELTLSAKRTLAYCPINKTWYFTDCRESLEN